MDKINYELSEQSKQFSEILSKFGGVQRSTLDSQQKLFTYYNELINSQIYPIISSQTNTTIGGFIAQSNKFYQNSIEFLSNVIRRSNEFTERNNQYQYSFNKRRENDIRRREDDIRRREENIRREEEEIRRGEEIRNRLREEIRREEEDINRRREIRKAEEDEIRRGEEDIRRREENIRRREEDIRRREQDITKGDAQLPKGNGIYYRYSKRKDTVNNKRCVGKVCKRNDYEGEDSKEDKKRFRVEQIKDFIPKEKFGDIVLEFISGVTKTIT